MSSLKNCLPIRTDIDRYTLIKPISSGGFSIVYLAVDQETKQKVVIKEYFPASLAKRLPDYKVVQNSEKTAYMLQSGRGLFFQEAKFLSLLKHPNIVNVISFFQANDTVYMVMEYESGQNLQSYIQKRKTALSELFILTVFPSLLDGLKKIHDSGYLHLDIKPGNIHIRPGGRPLLLDFGAAHRRELSRTLQPGQVFTVGYAPIEQYRKTGYVGPWTDLYALGATMYSCITGKPPKDSRIRRDDDKEISLTQSHPKKHNHLLLKAIDWCMETNPELRPQSITELLEKSPILDATSNVGNLQDSNNGLIKKRLGGNKSR